MIRSENEESLNLNTLNKNWWLVENDEINIGPSAKILNGNAQWIFPQHLGKWSWRAERRTKWSEKKWWRKKSNCRRNQRDNNQTQQMTHAWMAWVQTQTWTMRVWHVFHCENTTCKVWCSHLRRLQQTVNCKRSKFYESMALTTGLTVLSCRSSHKFSCGLTC